MLSLHPARAERAPHSHLGWRPNVRRVQALRLPSRLRPVTLTITLSVLRATRRNRAATSGAAGSARRGKDGGCEPRRDQGYRPLGARPSDGRRLGRQQGRVASASLMVSLPVGSREGSAGTPARRPRRGVPAAPPAAAASSRRIRSGGRRTVMRPMGTGRCQTLPAQTCPALDRGPPRLAGLRRFPPSRGDRKSGRSPAALEGAPPGDDKLD